MTTSIAARRACRVILGVIVPVAAAIASMPRKHARAGTAGNVGRRPRPADGAAIAPATVGVWLWEGAR